MNRTARQYRLIESLFDELESGKTSAPADAMLLLDELRRLERKWREQVEAGSGRRIDSDFRTLEGWYRRWGIAAKRVLANTVNDALRAAIQDVKRSLRENEMPPSAGREK
jgi:hypothetical protein